MQSNNGSRNILVYSILAGILGGCAHHPMMASVDKPASVKPVVETRTEYIVRVERIHVGLSPSQMTCPPTNPTAPLAPSPAKLGVYIAELVQTADGCRATYNALRAISSGQPIPGSQ
jgi:hypothetical protein